MSLKRHVIVYKSLMRRQLSTRHMATFTTIACLTRTYAIIFGSNKYELTRAQAQISSHLIGFIA